MCGDKPLPYPESEKRMNLSTSPARLVIAGVASGVGKTTIATGLMAALAAQGLRVQGYKVGPDYIDPTYHRAATGRASYNLDTWLSSPTLVRQRFEVGMRNADVAIIEGVMGLFDGRKQTLGTASTAEVAKLLNAPILLVLDVSHMGQSAAAIVHGFQHIDPHVNIAGVIVNRVASLDHEATVRLAITEWTNVPVLGTLRRDPSLTLPARHLGLIPIAETSVEVERLGAMITRSMDLASILRIAREAGSLPAGPPDVYKENILSRCRCVDDGFTPSRPLRSLVATPPIFPFSHKTCPKFAPMGACPHATLAVPASHPTSCDLVGTVPCACPCVMRHVWTGARHCPYAPVPTCGLVPSALDSHTGTWAGTAGAIPCGQYRLNKPPRSGGPPVGIGGAERGGGVFDRSCPPTETSYLSGIVPCGRPRPHTSPIARIGLALDNAFSFYYPETLEAFEQMGVEVVPFSPLTDRGLPNGLDLLYFGGGFPEVFAAQLANNQPMLTSVRRAAQDGILIYAECGGYMYLGKRCVDTQHVSHDLVGILPYTFQMGTERAQLGYRELTTLRETIIGPAGTHLRGHEFHWSHIAEPLIEKHVPYQFVGEGMAKEGYASKTVLASYIHVPLAANPKAMTELIRRCLKGRRLG
jgi:cobyrinic acid a,c-diamide synthase